MMMKNGIKVYVHGRPQGQDIWCAEEDSIDYHYLNPFLDSRLGGDVPAAMIIDVWQKHVYYTYIRRKNVLERSLRPEAYFAITVRLDGILGNSSIMFDLLAQVYDKLCVGELIEQIDGQEHIMVSNWKDKEQILRQITEVVSLNTEKKLLPTLLPLVDAKDTDKMKAKRWALKDIDCPLFLDECQVNRIVVSPYYKSKDCIHDDDLRRIVPLENRCEQLEKDSENWQNCYKKEKLEKEGLNKQVVELEKTVQELHSQLKTIEKNVAGQYEKKFDALKNSLDSMQKQLKQEQERCKELQGKLEKAIKELEKNRKTAPKKEGESGVNDGPIDNRKKLNLRQWKRFLGKKFVRVLRVFDTLLLIAILVMVIINSLPKANLITGRNSEVSTHNDTVAINDTVSRADTISVH